MHAVINGTPSPGVALRRVSVTISLSAKAAAMRMSTPRSLLPSLATALEPRRTLTPRTLARVGGGRSPPLTGCAAHIARMGETRAVLQCHALSTSRFYSCTLAR